MKVHVGMVTIPPIWWPLYDFVPQHVEFGVKFNFLLKFYAITWKDGWNASYLVTAKWILFLSMLSLMSNLASVEFFVTAWKDGWNISYLVVIICVLPPLCVLN
jgi:hypothetical protein